jgi:hypothetical protein
MASTMTVAGRGGRGGVAREDDDDGGGVRGGGGETDDETRGSRAWGVDRDVCERQAARVGERER